MDIRAESDRRSSAVALEGRLGQAYGEEAFRYFLEIERKRAARLAGRSFLLLLVRLKRHQTEPNLWTSTDLATTLFETMSLCLRETDVVGWFREDRVAGAMLTELVDGTQAHVSLLIRQRVSATLGETLGPDVVRRLHMRFVPVKRRMESI
jgi:hypothetical protein